MLISVSFAHAKAIGPSVDGDWFENQNPSLYWLARRKFSLPSIPDRSEILIAADRHYEIFINGKKIARQRGFFNGDEYLFAQRWREGICEALRCGENTIEVVIRSDPWRNKNYRCFKPMLTQVPQFRG